MTDSDTVALHDDLPVTPGRAANLLLYMVVGLVVVLVAWANFAELDKVTRGQGRVISSSQLQVVSNLEGGIVEEIKVKQGDVVAAGDVLIRLDNTQFNSVFLQGQEGHNALVAKIARLEAEANFAALEFDQSLAIGAPAQVAAERALFEAHRSQLEASLKVETAKLDQRRQSLDEARVTMATAREAEDLANAEVEMLKPLVAKGIEPRIELLRAEQRAAAARGDNRIAKLAAERAQAGVEEAQFEIEALRGRFRTESMEQLTEAKNDLAAMVKELPALQDRVSRTEVRSPITGTVNRVHVTTVGGIVRPGEPIVEIVPRDDTLLVEAFVNPSDIAFLRPGQQALVKLTAYDFSIYGGLEGSLETISADAIQNEQGESHYRIEVRTKSKVLKSKEGDLPIIPGMVAEVDVLNGKRSVWDYITKPLADVQSRALRDK